MYLMVLLAILVWPSKKDRQVDAGVLLPWWSPNNRLPSGARVQLTLSRQYQLASLTPVWRLVELYGAAG